MLKSELSIKLKPSTAIEADPLRYGRIDVLVNNASKQIMCKDFAEIDLENVESTFRSNILQM